MNITEEVILDLLPLFYAKEASEATGNLIVSYLTEHPDFAKKVEELQNEQLPVKIPQTLEQEDEMIALGKTKKMLRLRSSLFGLAIFFTALPFAFGDVSWSEIEGVHWLWTDFPLGAMLAGLVGVTCWVGYLITRKRLSTTAL